MKKYFSFCPRLLLLAGKITAGRKILPPYCRNKSLASETYSAAKTIAVNSTFESSRKFAANSKICHTVTVSTGNRAHDKSFTLAEVAANGSIVIYHIRIPISVTNTCGAIGAAPLSGNAGFRNTLCDAIR